MASILRVNTLTDASSNNSCMATVSQGYSKGLGNLIKELCTDVNIMLLIV